MQAAPRIRCGKADADKSWMSGYFSAAKNLAILDFNCAKRNAKVVGDYCKTHKADTVMNVMQKNWR